MALSFSIPAEAWSPLYHNNQCTQHFMPRRIDKKHDVVRVGLRDAAMRSSAKPRLSLFKYKETDSNSFQPIIKLDPEQDHILRDSTAIIEGTYGIGWLEEQVAWEDTKKTASNTTAH